MPTTYNKVTAGGNTLIDLSQDTVTQASHIMAGYVGHLADGTQVTGTGGGGGGLEYETGTYTPASNTAEPRISFSNSHSNRPFCAFIYDITQGVPGDSAASNIIISFYDLFGETLNMSYSNYVFYGIMEYCYTASNGSPSYGGSRLGTTTSLNNRLSSTTYIPYVGLTTRLFRSGRTYRWMAVWMST